MSEIIKKLRSHESMLSDISVRKATDQRDAMSVVKDQIASLNILVSRLGIVGLFEDIQANLWKTGKVTVDEGPYKYESERTFGKVTVSLSSTWPVFTIYNPRVEDENHQYEVIEPKPIIVNESECLSLSLEDNRINSTLLIPSDGKIERISINKDLSNIDKAKDKMEKIITEICYKKKWETNPVDERIALDRELIIQKLCDGTLKEGDGGMNLLLLTDEEKVRIQSEKTRRQNEIKLANQRKRKEEELRELQKPKKSFFKKLLG